MFYFLGFLPLRRAAGAAGVSILICLVLRVGVSSELPTLLLKALKKLLRSS